MPELICARPLGLADKPQLIELWRSRDRIFGQSKGERGYAGRFLDSIDKYLGGDPNRIQVGAFDERGRLLASLGLYLWETFPNCTFHNLTVHRAMTPLLYRADRNGLAACRAFCYAYGEERGRYQFYALTSLKNFRTVEKLRGNGGRYLRVVDTVIHAGTMPPYRGYQEMMGLRTWGADLVVFIDIVKPEYRPNPVLKN